MTQNEDLTKGVCKAPESGEISSRNNETGLRSPIPVKELTLEQLKALNELVEALLELFAPYFDAYYELACVLVEIMEVNDIDTK